MLVYLLYLSDYLSMKLSVTACLSTCGGCQVEEENMAIMKEEAAAIRFS